MLCNTQQTSKSGGFGMLDKNASIKCNVSSCKFNNKNKHYCQLETIQVGTHEKNPTQVECTDCQSFELE